MKLRNVPTLACLALSACVSQPPASLPPNGTIPEAAHSTIGYHSVDEAMAALRQKPTAQFRQDQGWTIVRDEELGKKQSHLWSFTPEGHPAHPAVAKRTVYEKNGSVWMDLNVHCGASKGACDQLVRDFQALTDRIQEQMRNPRQ